MPDAVAAFQKLGLAVPPNETTWLTGVRFASLTASAEAEFPADRRALSMRRTTLHRAMVERASSLGAELLWQTPVAEVSGNTVLLGERRVNARWIIGADGVHSRVRSWAMLTAPSHGRVRYSFRRHYRVTPWTDRMEIYWGRNSQAYATAIDNEQMCVAVASRDRSARFEAGLSEHPDLVSRLRGAEIASRERGAEIANRKLKRVSQGNVALVGDAAGTVDAISGEGLGLGFLQAIALVECLENGTLARYAEEHRRLARRPMMMARLMLLLDGRPRLQQRALDVFRKRPELFRRLLALHVGAISPLQMAGDGLSLGWGLLTA